MLSMLLSLLFPVLTVSTHNPNHTAQEIANEHKNVALLFHSDNVCKISSNAAHRFRQSDFHTKSFIIDNQDLKKPHNNPLCRYGFCSLPTFLFYKEKKIADVLLRWSYGAENQALTLREFYRRNEGDLYPPESLTQEMVDQEHAFVLDRAEDFRIYGFGVLIGGSFASKYIKQGVFINSDLRATSFKDAIIEGAVFTRANLKGASFKGAKLSNILWGACICPDGTKSADHGYTCEGHLKPFKYKTLPKTTLKPLPYQRPVPLTDELKDIGKDFEQRLDAASSKLDQQT